jgi:hypothetical protein
VLGLARLVVRPGGRRAALPSHPRRNRSSPLLLPRRLFRRWPRSVCDCDPRAADARSAADRRSAALRRPAPARMRRSTRRPRRHRALPLARRASVVEYRMCDVPLSPRHAAPGDARSRGPAIPDLVHRFQRRPRSGSVSRSAPAQGSPRQGRPSTGGRGEGTRRATRLRSCRSVEWPLHHAVRPDACRRHAHRSSHCRAPLGLATSPRPVDSRRSIRWIRGDHGHASRRDASVSRRCAALVPALRSRRSSRSRRHRHRSFGRRRLGCDRNRREPADRAWVGRAAPGPGGRARPGSRRAAPAMVCPGCDDRPLARREKPGPDAFEQAFGLAALRLARTGVSGCGVGVQRCGTGVAGETCLTAGSSACTG